MNKTTPEKLTLDIAKWRCGGCSGEKENRIGVGTTRMLNTDGFMCCLGQFSLQLGCNEEEIDGKNDPREVSRHANRRIPLLSIKKQNGSYVETNFSVDCIDINDNPNTTVREKVEKIRSRLKRSGIELVVKNKRLVKG